MTALEAHDFLAIRPTRSVLPSVAAMLDGVDVWPAFAAAFAVVSGMLDDCRTEAELDDRPAMSSTLRLAMTPIMRSAGSA